MSVERFRLPRACERRVRVVGFKSIFNDEVLTIVRSFSAFVDFVDEDFSVLS